MKKPDTISIEEGYISVTILGTQDLKKFNKLIVRIKKEAETTGYSRILVDLRNSKGSLSTIEKYTLAELPLHHDLLRFKWAYIDKPVKRADGFVGVVANNRGLQARLFFDQEEAIKWLTS